MNFIEAETKTPDSILEAELNKDSKDASNNSSEASKEGESSQESDSPKTKNITIGEENK